MKHTITSGDLQFSIDDSGKATLVDLSKGERLLILPSAFLLAPVTESPYGPAKISSSADQIFVAFGSADFDVKVEISAEVNGIVFGSTVLPKQDFAMERLTVLPADTHLNFFDVVNYRNRHYTPSTWPELLLGGRGCETDTFSRDWQFAPHPTMMMLRKSESILCLGALDLPTSFGMYLKAKDFTAKELVLNYGDAPHALTLPAGHPFHTPRFVMFLGATDSPVEVTAEYTQRIVDAGLIANPEAKDRYDWHREPLYCTWMDQGYLGDETPCAELGEQQLTSSNPTVEALDEAFVDRILEYMEQHDLRFRTFLMDDGWQVTRGQWEQHSERFPDLRRVVDKLHNKHMKVVVWWNWAEVFDDAEVDPRHVAGGDWRNEHGRRVRDYSNPATQEEYLRPLCRLLFSSEPGCYDFDGFKTDFLADKIHPEMPLHDPAWRGEENYAYQLFKLCYELMKEYKPDGCHIGCAGHPYLAEFIDINRTYDVATSNPKEHAMRGRMLRALTPGVPVAYDLHNYIERFDEYFQLARSEGASFEIGNILGMKMDRFSDWQPADERLFSPIRHAIQDWHVGVAVG